jgi:NADH-quinone oxidoreductase subunit G
VAEAVVRYLGAGPRARGSAGSSAAPIELDSLRGEKGVKAATLELEGEEVRIAVVQGIANAKRLAREIREGKVEFDLVEVMACPGGCIGGAGQPVSFDTETHRRRRERLYEHDAGRQLRRSSENPFLDAYYQTVLGGSPGSEAAHELLHTTYRSRKRIADAQIPLVSGSGEKKTTVRVCVGTSCFLRGSQSLLTKLIHRIAEEGLEEMVDVSATFCSEQCNLGPTVHVENETIHGADVESVIARLSERVGVYATS